MTDELPTTTGLSEAEVGRGRIALLDAGFMSARHLGSNRGPRSLQTEIAKVYSTYCSGVTTKSSGSFTPVAWFGQ